MKNENINPVENILPYWLNNLRGLRKIKLVGRMTNGLKCVIICVTIYLSRWIVYPTGLISTWLVVFLNVNVLYGQQNAAININLSQSVQDTISKNIYGGFIEFAYDDINGYRGLWAQEIENRGFDAPDTNDSTTAAKWLAFNSDINNNCVWSLDTSRFNPNGTYSQKVNVISFNSGVCGIGQIIYIKSGIYNFYTYLKGNAIDNLVTIAILDSSQNILDTISFSNIDNIWEKYSGSLLLNYEGFGIILFLISEQGEIWFDEASLMPQTALDGVRTEYINQFQTLNPTILRYPGGCFADGAANFWEYSIGDIDKRKSPNWDNFWGNYQRMDFGLHEYIKFCRNMNIEPQITVNFGTRDSIDARNLVEYCNADTTTYYGNLRKQNGSPEPFNIHFWEIGNEQYGSWEIGHTSATEYANRLKGYYNQMKMVDPSIKIIANGDIDNMTWTDTLLLIAGNKMDMISVHKGIPYIPTNDTLYTDEQVYKSMVASSIDFEKSIKIIENKLTILGLTDVKVALTEWWENFYCPKYQKHARTMETAVYVSCMLNVIHRNSYIIALANRTTFGEILKEYYPPFQFYLVPSSYVMSLYSNYSGDVMNNFTVICPTINTDALATIPAQDSVPLIDVSVTTRDSTIFINVANRSLTDDISTVINLTSGNNQSYIATVRSIKSNNYLDNNNINHDSISLMTDSVFSFSSDSFNVVFPAYSVTGIELDIITGIENIKTEKHCSIYPNPANNKVTIELKDLKDYNEIEFVLFDITGRQLIRKNIDSSITECNINLPDGVYLYKLHNNISNISCGKIIIMNE